MRKLLVILAMVTALMAGRVDGVVATVLDGVSATSGSSGVQKTDGGTITVQICGGTGGDVFTGTVTVKQGTAASRMVTIVTVSPSSLDGCSATYYLRGPTGADFAVAPYTEITYTRSGGKLYVYLNWEPTK